MATHDGPDDSDRDDDGTEGWCESLAHSLILLLGVAGLVAWVVAALKQ